MDDDRAARIAEAIEPLRVKPGRAVVLERDFDPGRTADYLDKKQGEELLQTGVELLREFQARLAAQNRYGLLVIIQALDAAGKDGTIKHVMSGVNPQGVHVASFKSPSPEELDHDYLWRCSKLLPARGDITIFNRSYYEEVLVVRVHPEYLAAERIPELGKEGDVWKRRYRDINNWERYLVDNGFPIVKLFLNISKEEQRQRFLDRLDEPDKNWKFSAGDAAERVHWDEYQKAFSEMISNTSTRWAPWYVIPADHKWFARIAAAAVIVNALEKIDPRFPVVSDEAKQELLKAKAVLEAEGPRNKRRRDEEPAKDGGEVAEDRTEATEGSIEASAEARTAEIEFVDEITPDDGDSGSTEPQEDDAKSASGRGLRGRVLDFGEIELGGKRYRNDIVIKAGKVRKRKKKPSKAYRGEDGHTPLSLAEDIPWGGSRIIVGTGIYGALPVMAEVYEEADRRGVEIVAAPLKEALQILGAIDKREAFAVLHVTC